MNLSAKNNMLNEDGLTVVATLALLVVAGLLILLGIYVRHHQTQTQASSVKTSSPAKTSQPSSSSGSSGAAKTSPGTTTTTPAASSPSSAAASAPPVANHNVINISALGASITVPDSIKDLTYYVASNSGGQVVVDFSTQSLTSAIPACAANQGIGAFDQIVRGNGQYTGPTNASSGALLKQYPTYYLAYILPAGPCANGLSTQNQALLDGQQQDFYTALSTVQATQ